MQILQFKFKVTSKMYPFSNVKVKCSYTLKTAYFVMVRDDLQVLVSQLSSLSILFK